MDKEYPTEITLETIWKLCQDLMWQEAYKILGTRTDSEDAVMDAIERIARNIHKFQFLEEREIIALTLIYTRHTAIDIYNLKKNGPVPVEETDMKKAIQVEPDQTTILKDLEELILRLLEEMPVAMGGTVMSHAEDSHFIVLLNKGKK